MDRPGKNKSEKYLIGKNGKNNIFLEAVYQLKKTADYSQNDPPGPEHKLKKKKIIIIIILTITKIFSSGWPIAAGVFFLSSKITFLNKKNNN